MHERIPIGRNRFLELRFVGLVFAHHAHSTASPNFFQEGNADDCPWQSLRFN
jgi:hypothetical protein